ncbi:MAG: class I SAM-dependent methyltransferase [Ktedonobacterales bacterium]
MRWFWQRRKTGTPPSTPSEGTGRRVFLGGRRYVADAPYILPKDLGEINRLDLQHYMLRHFLRANFLAPVRQPRDILDVGSGTGRWAIQMAQQFPGANVISLDIEAPVVRQSAVLGTQPENCVFVEGDVLKGLAFPDASFDLIHQRLLMGAIPGQAWPSVTQELVRVTRPGGWVELVEAAPVPSNTPALAQLHAWMRAATQMRGLDITIGSRIGDLLSRAGLRQVVYQELPIPIGPYGGRLGTMAETQYDALFQTFRPILVARGMTDAQTFDSVMRGAHREIAAYRFTSPYYLAYGQRA